VSSFLNGTPAQLNYIQSHYQSGQEDEKRDKSHASCFNPSDVRRPLMQTSHSKLISSMSSISSHKMKARQAMSLISHDLQHRCISCLFL